MNVPLEERILLDKKAVNMVGNEVNETIAEQYDH